MFVGGGVILWTWSGCLQRPEDISLPGAGVTGDYDSPDNFTDMWHQCSGREASYNCWAISLVSHLPSLILLPGPLDVKNKQTESICTILISSNF